MDVVRQRCAGIDVSKREGKVCVQVQGRGLTRTSVRVTTWSSSMPSILQLREKLVADGVELVVLELQGYYHQLKFVHLTLYPCFLQLENQGFFDRHQML